jgi:hypothetical protein
MEMSYEARYKIRRAAYLLRRYSWVPNHHGCGGCVVGGNPRIPTLTLGDLREKTNLCKSFQKLLMDSSENVRVNVKARTTRKMLTPKIAELMRGGPPTQACSEDKVTSK